MTHTAGGDAPIAALAPTPAVERLFSEVVGQPAAVAQLIAAAARPVHAYLLQGPPGSGKRAAAVAFAAALLCPSGGCGACDSCRRVVAGVHPDVLVVERAGASLDIDGARALIARAQRRPFEADRQVVIVPDVHLADRSAPALLKTLEEPPASTTFVLLAEDLPPSLATVASRCATIQFPPLSDSTVASWLVAKGVGEEQAFVVAVASGGRLDRARLLAVDPSFEERRQRWCAVPQRLDGTGAAAAQVAAELLSLTDETLSPLREQHAAELDDLDERAKVTGTSAVTPRRHLEERHRREERRWRTDELRFGLAALAGAYRDRLLASVATAGAEGGLGPVARTAEERRAARHVRAVEETSAALDRNAQEGLLMEALMVELSDMLE
jgi:DNA polymerase III subunit delta'